VPNPVPKKRAEEVLTKPAPKITLIYQESEPSKLSTGTNLHPPKPNTATTARANTTTHTPTTRTTKNTHSTFGTSPSSTPLKHTLFSSEDEAPKTTKSTSAGASTKSPSARVSTKTPEAGASKHLQQPKTRGVDEEFTKPPSQIIISTQEQKRGGYFEIVGDEVSEISDAEYHGSQPNMKRFSQLSQGKKTVVVKEDWIMKDKTMMAMQQTIDDLRLRNKELVEQRLKEHPPGSIGPDSSMYIETDYPKKEEDSEKILRSSSQTTM
jgi:hypothetical protein